MPKLQFESIVIVGEQRELVGSWCLESSKGCLIKKSQGPALVLLLEIETEIKLCFKYLTQALTRQ